MAATEKTDTTILGRYWMLNDNDQDLRDAISNLQFELDIREHRRSMSEKAAVRASERLAEVQQDIRAITHPESVYDHQVGGI